MAKFICEVVVETDEGKDERPPTKKALRESVERHLLEGYVELSGEGERYVFITRVRVRSVDLD